MKMKRSEGLSLFHDQFPTYCLEYMQELCEEPRKPQTALKCCNSEPRAGNRKVKVTKGVGWGRGGVLLETLTVSAASTVKIQTERVGDFLQVTTIPGHIVEERN